ncbi:hypothetical protein CEXT_422841 [Caerostris extrusa]|uniref:Uncharacterized protein n=1 Tax=Caerostris extrusa TaxID=172846 RepID=A0AAV4V5N9_CAEEX|nr:hypothetical protein CEXT_422841 [Caerostris extrusa]
MERLLLYIQRMLYQYQMPMTILHGTTSCLHTACALPVPDAHDCAMEHLLHTACTLSVPDAHDYTTWNTFLSTYSMCTTSNRCP